MMSFPSAVADEPIQRLLFDGKSLEGWSNPYEWGKVEVANGEIQLSGDKKFFLVTDQTYHDYEFEGELRLPEGQSNSGFMVRGQVKPNLVFGYQAEADPTERRWSGGLYDESRRQWLNPLWNKPAAQAAFDRDRWNRYRVRCDGTHLQIFVNDVPTTDMFDPVDLSGRIGLQHHGEKGQTYRFRNLKIRDLGRHEWISVLEDDSLEGWTAVGGGQWNVKDGVLSGRASSEANEPNGLLHSNVPYGDVTFRFEYRFARGDSGFFVRSTIDPKNPFIAGVQCEIDASDEVGGLYQTGGKGWLVRPLHYLNTEFPEDRRAIIRNRWKQARLGIHLEKADIRSEGEPPAAPESVWNAMVVVVHGNRIVTHLNGCMAADYVVKDLPPQGVVAFQLHGGQDLEVDFRNIQVLRKVQE